MPGWMVLLKFMSTLNQNVASGNNITFVDAIGYNETVLAFL